MKASDVKYLVVHCSDSPNDPYDGRLDGAADIHRWHKERGWDGIGYHFVIREDAHIEFGRPVYWKGAHVRSHNHESLGICLIGIDKFTDAQLGALRDLLTGLLTDFPNAKIVGHYELDKNKSCPNFNVQEWWNNGTA